MLLRILSSRYLVSCMRIEWLCDITILQVHDANR